MKKNIFIIISFLMFLSMGAVATSYTWVGSTSTAWALNANWNPSSGYPGSGDVATITSSGTYHPVLATNVTINGISITGGTLNLNGDTLLLNSGTSSFSGGTISNGLLQMRGSTYTFSGATLSATIDAVASGVVLNGGTFNNYCYFETNTVVPGSGTGGCTFNDSVVFYHNYTGGGVWTLSSTSSNHFNGKVRFRNKSTSRISTGGGISTFNADIVIENSDNGGIYLVGDTLKSGHTLSVGPNGYSDGEFRMPGFYQAGTSDLINLTFTGTALPTLDGTKFNGTVNITSNIFLFKNCIFNGTTTFTATGSSSSSWSGGNKFYADVTVTNNATAGNLRLDADTANTYYANATFAGSRDLRVTYGGTISSFYGNITTSSNVKFDQGAGTLCLAGSGTQSINFNSSTIVKNLKLNKSSGSASLAAGLTISGVTTFAKGNLTTTSSNLLILTSTSSVTGASDSSFIDGPVKKVGNSAFVFPVGKEDKYRFIEISAPSSSTNAYTAEYFMEGQTLGDTLDTVLTRISYCNYWTLNRNSGTTNVNVSFKWDSTFCIQFDTTDMKLGYWDNSSRKWVNKGHGSYTGNAYSGTITINSVSQYGTFTLASSAPNTCDLPIPSYNWSNTSASAQSLPAVLPLNPAPIYISGTFTVNQNLTINNYDIKLNANAVIEILSPYTLTLNSSYLHDCSTVMWRWIKINNGATLIVNRTIIEGADTAVWSNNGGRYTINNLSKINKCWKGIMVDGFSSAHQGSINNTWVGCATTAGGTTIATLPTPHSGKRTTKGIDVTGVTNSITFGTNSSTTQDVNFYNMDNGIYADGSNFKVYNCNFTKMDNKGYGINANISSGNYTIDVGGSANNACNFYNSTNGIFVSSLSTSAGYTPTLNNNNFNYVDEAISIRNINNKTIDCSYNEINYFKNGITLSNVIGSRINIEENNLNAPNHTFLPLLNLNNYGTAGISIINKVVNSVYNVAINSNYITNTRKGIFVSCVLASSLPSFNVEGNHVYIQILNSDLMGLTFNPKQHYGIQIVSSTYANVQSNTIERLPDLSTTPSPTFNLVEWDYIFGVQLNNVNLGQVHCNTLTNVSSGVNLRSVDNATELHENTYNDCARGVDLGYMFGIGYGVPTGGNPVTTNNHMMANFATNDTWTSISNTDPSYNLRVCGQNTPNFPPKIYRYLTGTAPYSSHWPANLYAPYFAGGLTYMAIAATGTAVSSCGAHMTFSRDTMLEEIVADTMQYSDFSLERRYIQLDYAYRLLDEDTTERLHLSDGKDSVYSAFYYRIANSNIGKYHRIEKLIYDQNYEDAVDSLTGITDTNRFEDLRHYVTDLYLSKIIAGTDLNGTDSTVLDYIARLCILEGGNAVSEARNILGLEIKDSCTTTGEARLAHKEQGKTSKAQPVYYLLIQPNPAHDILNIHYLKQGILTIRDITGRKIIDITLSSNTNKQQLNISNFPTGVYFYMYKPFDGNPKTGKFVKQ